LQKEKRGQKGVKYHNKEQLLVLVKPIVFFFAMRTPKVAYFVFGQIFSATFLRFSA
jgi:hypothetical protein